jgi:hypothetical protein
VLEASTLQEATSHGFTLSGSGQATVTTPAFYPPGRRRTVSVTDATGTHRSVVRAGKDRRLVITVDLGAANQLQQYSVPTQSFGTTVRQARVTIS